jgi:PHD/YefM family antitoxin component YafN of YafNO toxin-antitoxin module
MIELNPQYIKNNAGKNSFVVLPLGEYEELIEDLHDLAIIAERRKEPTMSLSELKNSLDISTDV